MQNWRTTHHCRSPEEAQRVINRLRRERAANGGTQPMRRQHGRHGQVLIQQCDHNHSLEYAAPAVNATRPKPIKPN
ncbi:MAG TPA: hypothetical protein VK054_01510 [Beutenbergiaceae bacterium]|nr:hypothetical protein [Beutenbergiaceae bacterium]